jgi:GR25 family glycosyltransferase involved in LPS biosynthesis
MRFNSKIFQKQGLLGMALFFEKILYSIAPKSQRLKFIFFVKFTQRLRSMFPACRSERDYGVYVINLDRDAERMKSFKRRADKLGVSFTRHRGLDCGEPGFSFGDYNDLLGNKFYGSDLFPRGSFASFLSHRQVWLRFLETSDAVALICEDDALLLGPLPTNAGDFHFPDGADIVFSNTRMGEGFFSKKYYESGQLDRPNYYGVFDALMNLCHDQIHLGGPGLDGYFVTRKGAQKLLALYEEVKYSMNNDWFVVFNSLSTEQRDAFRKAEASGRLDKVSLPDGPRLESYVMVPSLVELADFNTSIRMLDPAMLATREELLCGK